MSEPTPGNDGFSQQDIRIAAVLTGGVSLAVWISGVTVELAHLVLSSQGVDRWPEYRKVLDLLDARVRVDVIAGTSAGGLNGAFLAFGVAHRRDLTLLRTLWTESGSLEQLLRPTGDKTPQSLLRGDSYFLPSMTRALEAAVSEDNPALGPGTDEPIELMLTGTLWTGRQTAFTDDMGVGITELDYDATFRFTRDGSCGNLDDAATVIPQLASAGRCTSSFPGAFEPHAVTVSDPTEEPRRWQSSAGKANFDATQYVVDGGVLLNNPVRPALEAIYRQPGEHQVRRVLAYVNPDPGPPPAALSPELGPVPTANKVLLDVMTRLKSTESVSRQLGEIRERNASVRLRRKARARLSRAMTATQGLADALWDGYRAERTNSACSTIAHLVASGQPTAATTWSERELAEALARYAHDHGFPFVPAGEIGPAVARTGADWDWGETTVSRLADMAVDVLKRAVWLAPVDSDEQRLIVATRGGLARLLAEIHANERALETFWDRVGAAPRAAAAGGPSGPGPLPPRAGAASEAADNLRDLDAWVAQALPAFEATDPLGQGQGLRTARARQHAQVLQLATALVEARDAVTRVAAAGNKRVDPGGGQQGELAAMCDWLLPEQPSPSAVLDRMLRLDVVHLATAGAFGQVEQEVELVQVSCADRSAITGLQMHHFGAFYRAPWRVNDWIQGRLDGTRQLMRVLLSPERLRQRWDTPDELLAALEQVAVPAGPAETFLRDHWRAREATYRAETEAALSGTAPTSALDEVADALALPLQLQALADDLPALAEAIRAEKALTDAPPGSAQWLAAYDSRTQAASPGGPALSPADLTQLRDMLGLVGSQTIEADRGSDTFARTVAKTGVVTAGLLSPPARLQKVGVLRFTLSAARGYAAMVWALVSLMTRRSTFAVRLVELAVAVGGVMLATTILVPGIPLAFTLAAVLILLSGVTAAALLTADGGWLGLRALAALVITAVATVLLVWNAGDWRRSVVLATVAKALVGVLIVVLGAFVARAKPSGREVAAALVVAVLAVGGIVAAVLAQ